MRRLLLALPFALLPLAVAHAHDESDHDHQHASLGAHEHGVASLNVALDGNRLELELDTPAVNLVGFEHAASSAADKSKVAAVRQQLEQPLKLFGLGKDAGCGESSEDLQSPLFGDAPAAGHGHAHEHTDIHAHYQLTCSQPGKLAQLDLGPLFTAFPSAQKINVQLIGPNGQKGIQASATQTVVTF